jgi:hypothetical protein
MKILKQFVLILAMTISASIAVAAQDKDQKRRPPKEDPPKIVPGEKDRDKPRENRPKDEDKNKDDRGKKPQMFVYKTTEETKIIFG